MSSVKLNLSPLGKVKLALHTAQGLFIFVALFIFIAMATKDGNSKGAGVYYCVLALLSIPALLYLAAVPMWKRTQRFANIYAIMATDVVFAILWLAAWAALVAWVRDGIEDGAKSKKVDLKEAHCEVFDPKTFGTEAKCDLANALVGMGVTIFITFIVTSILSYIFFRKIRKEPEVPEPWLGKQTNKGGEYVPADPEAGNDNAWSTEMHDDTAYGGNNVPYDRPASAGTQRGGDKEEDEHELLHGAGAVGHGPTGHEYGPAAGHQYSLSAEDRLHDRLDDDTEYYGSGGYGHDDRNDANLPPYPATPYGAHVAPYDAPPTEPYGGAERPYSDRR